MMRARLGSSGSRMQVFRQQKKIREKVDVGERDAALAVVVVVRLLKRHHHQQLFTRVIDRIQCPTVSQSLEAINHSLTLSHGYFDS